MQQYWNKNKQHFYLCISLYVTVEEFLHSYFVKICTWISFALHDLYGHILTTTQLSPGMSLLYMPTKVMKKIIFLYSMYFFKIFMRCEAEGYCYDYWPNMGNHDLFHGRSIGEKVVKHLCRPLKYKCHHVFFWQVWDEKNNLTDKDRDIFLSWAFNVNCVCVTSYIIFLAQF